MYGHGGGFCCDPCGFGQQHYPSYGYPTQVAGVGTGAGKGFALIVVLFILLIIVGASKFHG
ncbi:YjcZ family sporulation protein [Salipaludibacillus agaradhaerens]|uniref:YjcZ family sporulation protein n=1 Tax=Salipaludibacillus agaradhaerens TaxID=76935 RepID=A0A9Q4FY10_SALAG|nr:YjcZ family sporulation protein [Salipaludibacillus agaradhaerens]MCR6095881.1 YjcZ family sporulation protein [Salipaludibacillus agaradhaerens]MCR6114560.1 YjcZ family sporulation protein [Salipaludibacillus agaradhaerens]